MSFEGSTMTDAISVDSIIAEQKKLEKSFQKAFDSMMKERETYQKKKAVLNKFNNKYGRVIKMMTED